MEWKVFTIYVIKKLLAGFHFLNATNITITVASLQSIIDILLLSLTHVVDGRFLRFWSQNLVTVVAVLLHS